jgi:hypothetical protein
VVATSGDYNAGQVTYTPPGTGGVATNVQAEVQRYGVWANDFGALCSGGGNDLTAFQSAINAAQTLAVPMKSTGAACVVSGTLNIAAAIDMSGQFENSVLYNPNLANNLIVINTTSAVYLHDFNMNYTPSAANSGVTAVTVTSPSGENGGSVFERLHIGNFAQVGINFQKTSNFRLVNSIVVGLQEAVIVANGNVADSGDSTISGNPFRAGAGGSGIVDNSTGGLSIINNKINANGNLAFGIQMALASGAFTADLFITGNSIEGISSTRAGIWFGRAGTTGGFGVVTITGNELSGLDGVDVPTDANGARLLNVSISGNPCVLANSASDVAFIDSTTGLAIGTNSVQSFNAGSKKVAIGSQVTGAYVDEPAGLGTFAPSTYSTGTISRNPFGTAVGSLSAAQDGSQAFVTGATAASQPCTAGTVTTTAFRQSGAWKCL